MAQITWRAPEALIERAQRLAAAEGISMNEFLSRVLALASDADETNPLAARAARTLTAPYPRSSEIGGLRGEMNARFEAIDRRFDYLDRDVQALTKHVLGRPE